MKYKHITAAQRGIAKKRKIPRSVFLRSLLEKEMEKDKDFQKENR